MIRLDLRREFGVVGANIRADDWSCRITELVHNPKSRQKPRGAFKDVN